MEIYQGRIACEIIIGGIDTEVGIGNDRTRHIDEVNNLLEVGGRCQGYCLYLLVLLWRTGDSGRAKSEEGEKGCWGRIVGRELGF